MLGLRPRRPGPARVGESEGAQGMETERRGWRNISRFRLGLLALAVAAGIGVWNSRPQRATIDRKIGRIIDDFTLPDSSGHPVSLHDYRGKAAVVMAFMGTECPVGNLYMPRLVELSEAYRDKGVA